MTIEVVNPAIIVVLDIQVIEDPAAATVALGPMRSRLLSELAFSNELTEAVTKPVSKHHDECHPGGRVHRLIVVAHPLPQKSNPKEPS